MKSVGKMAGLGDITIESEKGLLIDSLQIQISEFTDVVFNAAEGDLDNTSCLRFIDLYGDTTFNMLQKRVLARELESLIRNDANQGHREYLTPIIQFIRKYQDEVHTYVKFHGD